MKQKTVEEFLLKEKKDGTRVIVRDVQLALLEMMADIDEVCKKNHISYCLTGGSVIGAIRHQGFIPWDDDMDIAVMREDYQRFIASLKKDLDQEKYVFHCFETNHKYNPASGPAMKIRKKGTYIKEVNVLLPNRCTDCDGIYIDVFIYNHMAKSTVADLPLRLCNYGLGMVINFFENLHINMVPLKYWFLANAKLYGKLARRGQYLGDEITWIYRNPMKPLRYRKEKMFPPVRVSFEHLSLPVPHNAKEYLVRHYGKNVFQLPPVEKRKPGHVADINLQAPYPED